MKKLCFSFLLLVFTFTLFAQQAPPQGINYQAMVYVPYGNQQVGVNSAGQIPANTKQVLVKFTLEEGNNGPVIYEETQNEVTDQYGLLNAVIGIGTPTSNSPGLFNQIDWSQGDPYLRVSITLTQYNSTVTSYQKLWSVPYALYADQANSANTADYATNSGHADSSDYADLAGNGIAGVTDNGNGTLTFTYLDGSSFTTGVLSGLTGPQGPQGVQGPAGTAGPTGPQGIQGPAGNGFSNGTAINQIMYWNGTSWVALNPGTNSQVLAICNNNLTWVTINGICVSSITTLNCGTAINSGTLTTGLGASGASSSVPYTGGNGGAHFGQIVNSTGVTGLTATLASGNFANGSGNLIYTITGIPSTSGTASFALNIGGQSCVLNRSVSPDLISLYHTGSVFCASGPTTIVEVTNPTTGKTWMDRNLGASQVANSSTDANAYGDLYQWGRRNDGHQCRNSNTTFTISSSDQPNNSSFILTTGLPDDWRNPQNNNLWQGVNGVNNPCPLGYRIPTQIELQNEQFSWVLNNTLGAFFSPLKLTLAGRRVYSNGSINDLDTRGYYYSSTINGTDAYRLSFNNSTSDIISYKRADGRSIRCIKD
jgi:uncharacterized protein (TIGR02145 family)